MSHPVLDEMARVKDPAGIRADVWRRWMRAIAEDIRPQLDRLAADVAAEVDPRHHKKRGTAA